MSEYCLRWNNHQPNLVSVFSELLTSEALIDVTLAVDGHYINAHKLVLSACSDYFRDIFAANPCQHPIVIFKDIKVEDLKTVVDFIYKGEVNVVHDRLQDVLKTGELLKIKGLSETSKSHDEFSSQGLGFSSSSLGSQATTQRSSLTDSREHSTSLEDETTEPAFIPAPKKRKVTAHGSSDSTSDVIEEQERVEIKVEVSDIGDADDDKGNAEQQKGLHIIEPHKLESSTGDSHEDGANGTNRYNTEGNTGTQGTTEWPPIQFASTPWWAPMLPVLAAHQQHLVVPSPQHSHHLSTSTSHSSAIRPQDSISKSSRSPALGRIGSRESSPSNSGTGGLSLGNLDRPALVAMLGKEVSPQMLNALQAVASKRIRIKRGVLQRQPGIIRETPSDEKRDNFYDKRGESIEVNKSDISSEASINESCRMMVQQPLLQVPHAVVFSSSNVSTFDTPKLSKQSSHPSSLWLSASPTQITKQHSHPELAFTCSPVSSSSKNVGVVSYTSAATNSTATSSNGSSASLMQVLVKQRSVQNTTAQGSMLRRIKPKPVIVDPLDSTIVKAEVPVIHLSPSDDEPSISSYSHPRIPRAVSEEPALTRTPSIIVGNLLSPGPSPLSQSKSQDSGLDSNLYKPKPQTKLFATAGLTNLNVTPSTPSHCLKQREGPPLGCNYCWNSTDVQGRIMRRKTKYYCTVCRTNLCIVPCFHEYHKQMEQKQDTNKQIDKILTKTSSA